MIRFAKKPETTEEGLAPRKVAQAVEPQSAAPQKTGDKPRGRSKARKSGSDTPDDEKLI